MCFFSFMDLPFLNPPEKAPLVRGCLKNFCSISGGG